jgi:hypothetical protein
VSWADCGKDSRGRRIGYGFDATCDHREKGKKCRAKIDRGLGYACGGMHGADEFSCEGYFCGEHLYFSDNEEAPRQMCKACCDAADALVAPPPDGPAPDGEGR